MFKPILTANPFASPIPFLDGQAIAHNIGEMISPPRPRKKKKAKATTMPIVSTTVSGSRGSADLRFSNPLASHAEVERLRKEFDDDIDGLDDEVDALRAQVTKLEAQNSLQAMSAPAAWGGSAIPPLGTTYSPGSFGAQAPPSSSSSILNNPLMLVALMGGGGFGGGGGGIASNPLLLLALMGSSTSMPLGSVGNAPVSIDIGQVLMMQLVMRSLGGVQQPPKRV